MKNSVKTAVVVYVSMVFTFLLSGAVSCSRTKPPVSFESVKVTELYRDSTSIRAIELMGTSLAFAGSQGKFGSIDLASGQVRVGVQRYDSIIPSFRAVAHTASDFFMLSVENPALLYKTGENGKMELVYFEEGEGVFYDAMAFWDDQEGIAVGDSTNGCLGILITKDGGNSWRKLACSDLPEAITGEGAFAASDTNIKTMGTKVWIATTKRIWYSPDRGKTWQTIQVPINTSESTRGVYSIDFFDENLGIAFGGDYIKPQSNTKNKAITKDGGQTWQLINEGSGPGYRSCVQFVPHSGGLGIVAVGFPGIDYSKDGGHTWKHLSDESFYTVRFLNDSVAYAGGKNRIAKLVFR